MHTCLRVVGRACVRYVKARMPTLKFGMCFRHAKNPYALKDKLLVLLLHHGQGGEPHIPCEMQK